jgi:hypothetical protein
MTTDLFRNYVLPLSVGSKFCSAVEGHGFSRAITREIRDGFSPRGSRPMEI